MDPVRFGRALGVGTRAAAKTLLQAADAAAAPNPSPPPSATPNATQPAARSAQTHPAATRPAAATSAPRTPPTILRPAPKSADARRPPAQAGLREGARRFARETWNPFARLSGVLWLEVTGVFFGIFAAFALLAAWRLRTAWRATPANAAEHQRLLGALAMLAVFGYFCVSSFLRARRRERRR